MIDLLNQLIVFDARERLSAEGCLAHPYFAELADPDDEPNVSERLSAEGCLAHPYFAELADPDDEPNVRPHAACRPRAALHTLTLRN